MASKISTYLSQILSAVYGKDVRQSIHDAIKQCYDDVTNPTLNTEALKTAIQAKIDEGEMSNLALADGDVTTEKIADGAVTKEKIDPSLEFGVKDGVITLNKLSRDLNIPISFLEGYIEEIVTLADTTLMLNGMDNPDEWESGIVYDTNTGEQTTGSSDSGTSGFIRVVSGATIKQPQRVSVTFWDKAKNFISGNTSDGTNVQNITVPETAYYIRCSSSRSSNWQAANHDYWRAYTNMYVSSQSLDVEIDWKNVKNVVLNMKSLDDVKMCNAEKDVNLIKTSEIIQDSFYYPDGSIDTLNGRSMWCTAPLEVSEGEILYAYFNNATSGLSAIAQLYAYATKEQTTQTSILQNTEGKHTIPSGIKYVIAHVSMDHIYDETTGAFVEYGTPKESIVISHTNHGEAYEEKEGLTEQNYRQENLVIEEKNLSYGVKKMLTGSNGVLVVQTGELPKIFITSDKEFTSLSKESASNGVMEFVDGQTKFELPITLKYQGSGSLVYNKKNLNITVYEDDTYATKQEIQFNDWYPSKKFHLKANEYDYSMVRNCVGTQLAYQWMGKNLPNGAIGYVKSFPVIMYYNGEYYGCYTVNLPQEGDLFNMSKKNENHLVYRFGAINGWTDMTDWEYRGDADETDSMRQKMTDLVTFMTDTENLTKESIAAHFDIETLLSYLVFAQLAYCGDSLVNNWTVATWDGVTWYHIYYDLDMCFGMYNGYEPAATADVFGTEQGNRNTFFTKVKVLYAEEMNIIYANMRRYGADVDSIVKAFTDFQHIWGWQNILADRTKWAEDKPNTTDITNLKNWMTERLAYLDTLYSFAG